MFPSWEQFSCISIHTDQKIINEECCMQKTGFLRIFFSHGTFKSWCHWQVKTRLNVYVSTTFHNIKLMLQFFFSLIKFVSIHVQFKRQIPQRPQISGKMLTAGPARLLGLRKTKPRTLTQFHQWAMVPDRVWLLTVWTLHNAYMDWSFSYELLHKIMSATEKKRHRSLNITNAS